MRTTGFVIAGLALGVIALPSLVRAAGGENASSLMGVKIPAALIAKANDPKPPADATKKTSIG